MFGPGPDRKSSAVRVLPKLHGNHIYSDDSSRLFLLYEFKPRLLDVSRYYDEDNNPLHLRDARGRIPVLHVTCRVDDNFECPGQHRHGMGTRWT
jgi:hypothetical protein